MVIWNLAVLKQIKLKIIILSLNFFTKKISSSTEYVKIEARPLANLSKRVFGRWKRTHLFISNVIIATKNFNTNTLGATVCRLCVLISGKSKHCSKHISDKQLLITISSETNDGNKDIHYFPTGDAHLSTVHKSKIPLQFLKKQFCLHSGMFRAFQSKRSSLTEFSVSRKFPFNHPKKRETNHQANNPEII